MDSQRPYVRTDRIGVITHGSLSKGVEMKLDADRSVEDVVAGTFVVIQGGRYDFFSLINDVRLDAANENILLYPPDRTDELLQRVMQGMGAYSTVSMKPMLMVENSVHPELVQGEPRAVKTVPAHFSQVARANREDVTRIFGDESHLDGRTFFQIGEPLGMDGIPVCLNLHRFVERSNAVFGKTGTGKTFLTRLLLCGTIKTGTAVNLIFDMHSEYGQGAHQESGPGERGAFVEGLGELFPSRVAVFTLDPQSTRRRGGRVDHTVFLYADQIEPADILPLKETLNLNPTAEETCDSLRRLYGKRWLARLLATQGDAVLEEMADKTGAHPLSLRALRRKLGQFTKHGFFSTEPSHGKIDVLDSLLECIDRGTSVVFEFGRYDSLQVYLLVANVITRRIRAAYEEKTDRYRQTKQPADKPRQLMITIEEAHKFLAPGIARETPFGQIAREMRKYYVSLLVVDQRPSAIDEEVLSQIGTKIVGQLSDEKDISATLVGTSDSSVLRNVLSSMDAKQQALMMGHAVPMPIVLRTRTYDKAFFGAVRDRPAIDAGVLALVQG